MKKIIAMSLVTALTLLVVSPVIVAANGDGDVKTNLTRSTGGGASPIIKAKFEMYGPYSDLSGDDESQKMSGAQFAPPGEWDQEIDFSICAIVTDPDGASDIYGVYTDWYFPSDIAFHPEAEDPFDDQDGGGIENLPDYGQTGCGEMYEDENQLSQLSKDDGLELFCDNIRGNNNNLPTFFGSYDYDEICAADGELQKETAYVYCADKQLIWEDPAGDYKVEILALDKAGMSSYEGPTNPNYNYFEYLPLTAFETDFESIDYGNVKLNTHKIISGDLTWEDDGNRASVRNLGNTRLNMHVEQDDMGFSTTDGKWNIRYDARVGNNDADWSVYYPYEEAQLEDILNLSEIEEMDFSIEIFKFPTNNPTYGGEMWLNASAAEFRECVPRKG